jgi:hypothetical protein
MPEICTCGAELPPDARFCHKCGKPQREEPVADALARERQAPVVPASVAAVVSPVPLSFRNPVALRVGLLASALLCLMMMIPGVNYASVVWWLGAGYFSVWVYKRRTGQPMTVRGGAHMGCITGVLSCVLLSVLFALIMAAIERAGGLGALKNQLHDLAIDQKTIDEAVKRLQNPLDIVTSLAGMFLMMMLFCAAGGALGAKILGRD